MDRQPSKLFPRLGCYACGKRCQYHGSRQTPSEPPKDKHGNHIIPTMSDRYGCNSSRWMWSSC
jgi:hypothetical protein